MSVRVGVDGFSNAIMSELNIFETSVKKGINAASKSAATDGAKELRKISPVRSDGYNRKYPPGSYAKSWTNKVTGTNLGIEQRTIYNAKHYQIAHLLENGHVIVANGKRYGMSRAIPHISTVDQSVAEKFEREVRAMKFD